MSSGRCSKRETGVCEALDAEDIVDHLGVTALKEVEEWRHPKEELVKEEEKELVKKEELLKEEELVKKEEERMTMTVEERLAEDIKVKVGKNITNPL